MDNVINDFRPPPQVESSVIRLVPPSVEFEEFDRMNRVIFSRPNKTVRGNIPKGVMKMLEQNRRTWMSAQEMVYITHSYFQGLWRRFPYLPTDAHLSQPVDSNTSISEPADKVLTEVGRPESRASKMDIDDLFRCGNKHTDDSNTWQAVICIPRRRDPFSWSYLSQRSPEMSSACSAYIFVPWLCDIQTCIILIYNTVLHFTLLCLKISSVS